MQNSRFKTSIVQENPMINKPEIGNHQEDASADQTPPLFYLSKDPISEEKKESHPRKIMFDLYERSEVKANQSEYVRISSTVPEESFTKNLTERVWGKHFYPELAVTFLGGCREHLLSEPVKKCLRKFISSTVKKFKCCLITRGTYVGVAKIVGKICSIETLKWNYGCMSKSIGVLHWQNLYGKDYLLSNEDASIIDYPLFSRNDIASSRDRNWPMDPNHDYYYLVDEGSSDVSHRVDTDFIVKLNSMLLRGIKKKLAVPVPCVMILTGGGKQSLEIMYKFLCLQESKHAVSVLRPTPVVIILKGSGKLADLLSYILELHKRNSNCDIDSAIARAQEDMNTSKKDQRSKQIYSDFIDELNDNQNQTYKDMVKHLIARKGKQIIVFDVENDEKEDLVTVLLKTVIDAVPDSDTCFLFAMYAGQAYIVRDYFQKYPALAPGMMTYTLLKSDNLSRAKDLLEKYKFNVEGYVKDHLWNLYRLKKAKRPRVNSLMNEQQDVFNIDEAMLDLTDVTTEDIIHTIKKESVIAEEEKIHDQDIRKNTVTVNKENIQDHDIQDNPYTVKEEEIHNHDIKESSFTLKEKKFHEKDVITVNYKIINPIQALLINSILFLDVNAAKLFWHFDPYNPLSNALLAYALLNGLEQKAQEVSRFAPNDFKNILGYFESLIGALLETYYKVDRNMAEMVLRKQILVWNGKNLIEVAGEIGLKSFFSQQACQSILEKDWNKPREGPESRRHSKVHDMIEISQKDTRSSLSRLTTPIWKMRLHLLVYMISLGIFAFYVLFTNTAAHEPIKWTVATIVLSLTVDEVRQVTDADKGFVRNFLQWASSIWNQFDFAAIILFFTGLAFSYYYNYVSKVMFSLYLAVSCLKVMQFLRAMNVIGVYLVMIEKMLGRMKMFLIVFLVTILGYGMFMTALLYPDTTFDWTILFRIFFRPSLVLIGEPGIESFHLSKTTTVFGTKKVNLTSEILVIFGMAIFLLFANILLVNLLIADFSNIHSEVSAISQEIWRYEQHHLLQEFKCKPNLPIPFSVFENLRTLFRKCRKKAKKPSENQPENIAERLKKRRIAEFERFCFKKQFPKIPDEIIYPNSEAALQRR